MTPEERKGRARAMQPWYTLGLMFVVISITIGVGVRGAWGSYEPFKDAVAGALAGVGLVFLFYALIRIRRWRAGQTSGSC